MSKNKTLSSAEVDSPDVGSHPLDEFVAEVCERNNLAAQGLSDDEAMEQLGKEALAELTDEDVKAIESLGSSEAFIGEVLAAYAEARRPAQQGDLPTARGGGETVAEPVSSFYVGTKGEVSGDVRDDVQSAANSDRFRFRTNYRKTTELGRGGQGIVYRIEGEDDFHATAALKVFSSQAYDSNEAFVADMLRMKSVASLIHHDPHDDLVDIDWFGEHAGGYAMLMQYIDGFDLRHLTQPKLKLQLQQCVDANRWPTINNVVYSLHDSHRLALQPAIAVYIIERVLRGLEALHSRGIVHGDIKPSNIMLNASGSVKIIDVGSAFQIDAPPKEHYVTPAYSAPEFLDTQKMSPQSDLASVGYVLIELLSGKSLADGMRGPDESTRTICEDRREQLLEAKQTLPNRLGGILPQNILESHNLMELCRRLIQPDLERRFKTATETIVDSNGTFAFSKDLIRSDLGVCNFQELRQWLADVKRAMSRPRRNAPPQ